MDLLYTNYRYKSIIYLFSFFKLNSFVFLSFNELCFGKYQWWMGITFLCHILYCCHQKYLFLFQLHGTYIINAIYTYDVSNIEINKNIYDGSIFWKQTFNKSYINLQQSHIFTTSHRLHHKYLYTSTIISRYTIIKYVNYNSIQRVSFDW